jgi:GH3 auxin-responsive promoter
MKLASSGTYSRKFVKLGASLMATRTTKHLKDSFDDKLQSKAYSKLVTALSKTSAWSSVGVENHLPYEEFQATVALHRYEDLYSFIERMKSGEPDVLWPGKCIYYAVSSGTTAGRTKYIPVTKAMLSHFRKAGLNSLLYYSSRRPNANVFQGKHLFLGGSTGLTPIKSSSTFKAYCGDLSGITARHLPRWVEKYLFEPGIEIAAMDDWPKKIDAIAARTQLTDISLIAGIPSWILILAEAIKKKTGVENLQKLWPRFECLIHGGVPIGPYVTELRRALGSTVNFHEVYPASEGFIAAQDSHISDFGMRLMTDCGIFYEFLPLRDFDHTRLSSLGAKAVPLSQVDIDVDYALIMSTPAGLCRYVIGDVVRFTSVNPPRLTYVGRTALQLSAFGEHVIEKELTDSLVSTANKYNLSIADFHVAPLFPKPEIGRLRGCHEWWIELTSGKIEELNIFRDTLDETLQAKNEDYEVKRKAGGLSEPVIRILKPGTFELWLKSRGKWGGQNKTPRCRSDREVATSLESLV